MIGTLVNVTVIVLATALGVLLKRGISEKVQQVVMQGLGLCVLIIGLMSAITTKLPLLLVFSISVGGIIGTVIGIERRLDAWGDRTQARFHKEGGVPFAEGLVTATITFCVGAMAILGSIESGLHHNYQLLFVKSALDGFLAMMLATKFGFGVALSAVPVLLYQGAITLGCGVPCPAFDRRNDGGGFGRRRRADLRHRLQPAQHQKNLCGRYAARRADPPAVFSAAEFVLAFF